MKYLLYFFIGIAFSVTSCKQEEQTIEKEEISTLQEKFDTYFNALTSIGKFNGVISVSKDGNEVIYKAYNLSLDTENSLFVSKESQFDIHSVSKTMAKYLLLQLEQNHKISPQDQLSKFIPDFPNADNITIEMLMQHKSGLPREFSDFQGKKIELDVEETIELIKQEELVFEPGKGIQYSNLGYQLLYYIIQELTDKTFEQHLTDELFTPLGMKNSGAHFYSTKQNLVNLASNHELDDDTIVRVDNILEDESKQARIYSTAADLMLMLDDFQKNPLSNKIAKDSLIRQSGGSDGIRTHIYTNLHSNTNFVLLTNFDGLPFEKVINDMVNMIEGKPYVIPRALNRKSIRVEASILNKYIGTYLFADLNAEILIEVDANELVIIQDNEEVGRLVAENDSTFFENPKEEESFEFKLNANGNYDVLMGFRGVKLKGIRK